MSEFWKAALITAALVFFARFATIILKKKR